MRRNGALLTLAILLCAGIAVYSSRALNLLRTGAPAPVPSAVASEPEPDAVLALRPATFEPERVDLDEILDHAIFEPTRSRPRPAPEPEPEPEPEPQVEAPEPEPSLDITILGIVLQGDVGFLVIREDRGARLRQLSPGDTVDGWTLLELSEFVAVFERDGEERRLNLSLR